MLDLARVKAFFRRAERQLQDAEEPGNHLDSSRRHVMKKVEWWAMLDERR